MKLAKSSIAFLLLMFAQAAMGQCPPSGVAGTVNICAPAANSTVSSPVTFQAAATPPSGQVITAMRLYVDNVALFTVNANSLNTTQTLANGTHAVVINAWSNTGAVFQGRESITVSTSNVVSVSISPTSVQLAVNATQQFTAQVHNNTNQQVTWSVDGTNGGSSGAGTITSGGLYTAPASSGNHTVTATAVADPTKSASAAVTVGGNSCSPMPSTVTICAPAANSTVPSPVTFMAVAGAPSGQTITAMRLYVDSVALFTVNAATLTTTQTLANGGHAVVINAWTNTGAVFVGRESITVGGTGQISVTVSPSSAQVFTGGTQQFTATVQNANNTAVTWSVDGTTGGSTSTGTISTGGLYTAPTTTGTHTVVATSVQDTSKSGSASVTVTVPTPSVTVTPSSANVQINAQQQFTAHIQNSQTTTVNWSVDGTQGGSTSVGTVSSNGLYTAPATTGTHTVTATLSTNNNVFGNATVNVTNGNTQSVSVLTYGYGNGRTAANTQETILTPASISAPGGFGVKGSWSLDGFSFTQPLYVPGVDVNGNTVNVLYVGTENDSVYALDADNPGTVLWKRSFLGNGATIGRAYQGGRTNLGGSVGITGTPVIDANNSKLYVVARTTENSNQVQRIHAIDIRSGAEVGTPTVIQGSVAGTGMGSNGGRLAFDPLTQNQRSALLLTNGTVYVAFASFGDDDPYHGWVFGYNASNLQQVAIYNTSVNSGGSGIWMAGAGPAADANGNVYLATANGRPDATALFQYPTDMPQSVLKLHLGNGTLTITDYFTPYNVRCLSADDLDLGSSGAPMLIPNVLNGHNAMAIASKEGRVYLIDSNNMGHHQSGSDSQILSSQLFNPLGACGGSNFDANSPWRVYGVPAYWNGNIYFASAFGPMRQYNVSNATLNQTHLGSYVYHANGQNGRSALTSISSNGSQNAIVWTVENDLSGNGWLRAYDATDVSKPQLYFNNFGGGINFTIPTVVNGAVYTSGRSKIYMYGILP